MELVLSVSMGVLVASGMWLILRPRTFQVIIGLCLPVALVNLVASFILAPLPGLVSLLFGLVLLALGIYLWRFSPMWARPARGWASAW